jgi:hypothetical protein
MLLGSYENVCIRMCKLQGVLDKCCVSDVVLSTVWHVLVNPAAPAGVQDGCHCLSLIKHQKRTCSPIL